MKYAVIYKDSYESAPYDRNDLGSIVHYDTIKLFDSKENLIHWIKEEETRYAKKTYRVIQYEDLKVTKTIQIELDQV